MFRYFVETNDCKIIEVRAYREKSGKGYETFDDYKQLRQGNDIGITVNMWLVSYKETLQFQTTDQYKYYLGFNYIRYFWEEEWPD